MKIRIQKNWTLAIYLSSCFIFVAYLSGSQVFSGSYTPDSEFYFTLQNYGNEINSRAFEPAYYWTRLGKIVPIRLLGQFFSYSISAEIYRNFLLLIIFTSVFVLTYKLSKSALVGVFSASFFSLNSVILYFTGDQYITGSVLTGGTLSLCLTLIKGLNLSKQILLCQILSGAALGWLLVLHPYGFFLYFISSLSLNIYFYLVKSHRYFNFLKNEFVEIISLSMTFLLFLIAGQRIFPNYSWFQTTLYWIQILNPTDFAPQSLKYLLYETSFFVIYVIIILSLLFFFLTKNFVPLLLVIFSVALPVIFTIINNGAHLYARYQTSLIWPFILIAYSLIIVYYFQRFNIDKLKLTPFLLLLLIFVIAGHIKTFPLYFLYSLPLICVIFFLISFFIPSYNSFIFFLVFSCASFQLFQNTSPRGDFPFVSGQPYWLAFNSSQTKINLEKGVEIQNWVLENTKITDKLLVWNEPGADLIKYAAFQLWGPNSIDNATILSDYGLNSLISRNPEQIIIYYKDQTKADKYLLSMGSNGFRYIPRTCKKFLEPDPIFVCIYNKLL